MKIVLGINLSHDTSVCLIKDGRIYAAEEERWTKLKHNSNYNEDYIFPHNALEYVLRDSSSKIEDIDKVVCVSMSEHDVLGEKIEKRDELACFDDVIYISHHKAHVLSGFLLSPFDETVGVCIDGGGSIIGLDFNTRERTTGYYCSGENINRIYSTWDKREVHDSRIKSISNSLGLFYMNFAQRCIPKGDEPEGTMMALSAFGSENDNKYYPEIKKIITLLPNGGYEIAEPYGHNSRLAYSFGGYKWKLFNKNEDIPFEERANMALAVQLVFEETVIHILNHLHKLTNCSNLVFSGGCALNSRLNGAIASKTAFKNVYIPPAPHDGGTAVGAALYAWNYLLHEKRISSPTTVDWGPEVERINEADVLRLSSAGIESREYGEEELYDKVASMISEGKVLIWARGRMEFGPRALGNRSIIGKSDDIEIRERINSIKRRAWYRPLAPSVLDKSFGDFFSGDADCYMNKVSSVCNSERIPAVVHKDNTARVQVVKENNMFYLLLMNMLKKGMKPIVLNTSLNLKGIPIARSKEDILNAFATLDVDAAVIGNFIITKKREE